MLNVNAAEREAQSYIDISLILQINCANVCLVLGWRGRCFRQVTTLILPVVWSCIKGLLEEVLHKILR